MQGFTFDLFTSFPVSFMEAAILASCKEGETGSMDIPPSSLRYKLPCCNIFLSLCWLPDLLTELVLNSCSQHRMIRVIKPLRLFKLVRIIKVVKTLSIADAIADRFRIPPRILRLMKARNICAEDCQKDGVN